MAWKKVPDKLKKYLEDKLADTPCEQRQMFGCPVYFVNGNMFAGLHQDDVMVRLSEEDRAKIMEEYDEAHLFEPMKGRKMKEYMVLPEELVSDEELFYEWLERSYGYASSLPPKKPDKKGGKGAKVAGSKGGRKKK